MVRIARGALRRRDPLVASVGGLAVTITTSIVLAFDAMRDPTPWASVTRRFGAARSRIDRAAPATSS